MSSRGRLRKHRARTAYAVAVTLPILCIFGRVDTSLAQAVDSILQKRQKAELLDRLPQALQSPVVTRQIEEDISASGIEELATGQFTYQPGQTATIDSQVVARPGTTSQEVAALRVGSVVRPADSSSTAPILSTAGAKARVFAIPYRIVIPTAVKPEGAVLTPLFWTQPEWLTLNTETHQFLTKLRLALVDPRSTARQDLVTPIVVYITSQADSVRPDSVTFTAANQPSEPLVIVTEAATDSVHSSVKALALEGVDFWIPVRPALDIAAPSRMQAWGVEKATVTVRFVGALLEPDDSASIRLSLVGGSIDDAELTLDPSGAASTTIRSGGLGSGILQATTSSRPGVAPASLNIDYIFPIYFLIAAILGGALGGLAQGLQSDRQPKRLVLVGLVLGLVAATAYFIIGIRLFPIDVGIRHFNDGAVFALAVVASYSMLRRPDEARSQPVDTAVH